MRFYADAALAITAKLKKVFQHACTQAEFEMAAIVDMANSENRSGFEVEIEWVEFDKEENTWELGKDCPLVFRWDFFASYPCFFCYVNICLS